MDLFCMFEHTHIMGDKTFWKCNDLVMNIEPHTDNKLAKKGCIHTTLHTQEPQ